MVLDDETRQALDIFRKLSPERQDILMEVLELMVELEETTQVSTTEA